MVRFMQVNILTINSMVSVHSLARLRANMLDSSAMVRRMAKGRKYF